MRVIYIVFDKDSNREILRTVNRVLAYRLILKSNNHYVIYVRKEKI